MIYDSYFGCTQNIAEAIGLSLVDNAEVINVQNINMALLPNIDVLIVGSPTRGFRPSEGIQKFLKSIPKNSLKGIKVAAFDTRLELSTINSKALRYIVEQGGYAAKSILKKLEKKGGIMITDPEGFLVTGEKGPLKEGETERAQKWVNELFVKSSTI